MALPKLDTPIYTVVIPSTKQSLEIRPFLVKEEKILLMALQGGDAEDMTRATKQIINNCIVTPNFDIDTLEMYDVEYILLQLRINSIGETSKIKFLAREGSDCPECSKERIVEIDLRNAKILYDDKHTKKVQLTPTVGLIMKYPNVKMLDSLEQARTSKSVDELFKIIWGCVETVFDSDKLNKASEVPIEEGVAFLESLSSQQFAQIEVFFATMPKLKQVIHINCGGCLFSQDYTLEGLEAFFG